MRIAILTNTFPPDAKGGAERVAFLQVEGLKKAGHEVRVWAATNTRSSNTRSTGPVMIALEHEGVMWFLAPDLARMNPLARLWFHLVTDARPRQDIVGDIFTWKPDQLITHNLTGCGMVTPRAIQAHGITWTHVLHDIQLTDPSGQETDAWSRTWIAKRWRAFWSTRRRVSFGTPDVLVSPTQWLLDWHHRHGFHGTAERVTPNPIETVPSRIRALKTPATVIYIGRLSRDKGFDRFLEVITKLPTSLVDQITIIGTGPMAAAAKRLADARIDLTGTLPPETVRALLADADVLIAPSRLLENQQNILLEAMSVGTPAIATDVGGTRETLEGTGCPVVSEDRLIEETIRLLSHDATWRDISQKMEKNAQRRNIKVPTFNQ